MNGEETVYSLEKEALSALDKRAYKRISIKVVKNELSGQQPFSYFYARGIMWESITRKELTKIIDEL